MVKELHVSCAIIERNGLVLAAQRSARMALPFKWEFPGGKIEKHETASDALRREIFEELGLEIELHYALPAHPFAQHHDQRLILWPFLGRIKTGHIQLAEHAQIRWCTPNELQQLDWAPADWPVLHSYLALIGPIPPPAPRDTA